MGQPPPGGKSLEAPQKSWGGQIGNQFQMYSSDNATCIQTDPVVAPLTLTVLSVQGSSKVNSSVGKWWFLLHTKCQQRRWWGSRVNSSFKPLTCTVCVKKKLPINVPFNGRPFRKNGERTDTERMSNGL